MTVVLSHCPRKNGVTVVYLSHVLSGANDAGEIGMFYRRLDSGGWTDGEAMGNIFSAMCVQVQQRQYVLHIYMRVGTSLFATPWRKPRMCGGACEREVAWAAPFAAVRQVSVLCMSGVRPMLTCIVIHPSRKRWILWKCIRKTEVWYLPKLSTWAGPLLCKPVGSN